LAALAAPTTGPPDRRTSGQRLGLPIALDEGTTEAGSILVSAAASDPDGDELGFRWSAPVGSFLEPMAAETKYVCPKTPRPTTVTVTVTVTDANGAAATDTTEVHCGDTR
jgi:hypothetical protein